MFSIEIFDDCSYVQIFTRKVWSPIDSNQLHNHVCRKFRSRGDYRELFWITHNFKITKIRKYAILA